MNVLSIANVFNHLHLEIKLSNRFGYTPFIRAVTGAIAMSVTGRSRWNRETRADENRKAKGAGKAATGDQKSSKKFWDHRPFTRITNSFKDFLNLKDYVRMNAIESDGYKRDEARSMVEVERMLEGTS